MTNPFSPIKKEPPVSSADSEIQDSLDVDIGTDKGPTQAYLVTAYHLAILIGAAIIVLLTYRGTITENDAIKKALFALCLGAAGGTLTASRYVVYSVRHSIYDPRRLLWQLMSPLHSSILAGVALLTIKSGLFTLGQPLSPEEPKHTLAIMAFSFLVGLASESFVKKLIVAIEALFGERGDLAQEPRGSNVKENGTRRGEPAKSDQSDQS